MVVCKVCKESSPNIFPQRTTKQVWWGGWTCPYCGTEYDKKGNITKKYPKKLEEHKKDVFEKEYLLEKARLKAQEEFNEGKKSK